mgnify:CR=1 FL=1
MILFAVFNSVKIDKGTRLRIYISSQLQSVKSHETADLRHKSLGTEVESRAANTLIAVKFSWGEKENMRKFTPE